MAIQSVSAPAHGTAAPTLGGAELTYQPNADFCGNDSFTYSVNGGDNATVSVSVSCVNDAPSFVPGADQIVAPGAGAQTVSGWATSISTGPANESGQTATFEVANSANALFSVQPSISTAGTLTFTGAAAASGVATVTVTLRDNGGTALGGADASAAETFTITIDSLPTADAQSKTTDEDTAVDITLTGTDEEGNALTFAIASGPGKGALGAISAPLCAGVPSVCSATVTYTPGLDNSGADSFTFTASDGTSTSAPASVSITITPIDDAPTAVADAVSVAEDSGPTPLTVTANDSDVDAGPRTIISVTQPASGSVSIHADLDKVVYTPPADYCNNPPGTTPTTFTYTLNGNSTATVTVGVDCVNDAPQAVDDAATVAEDTIAAAIPVLANDSDIDSDPLSVASVTQPANGTVVITGGGTGLTYQPNPDTCNAPPGTTPDTFTYTLDGGSTATVAVTVTCVDDPPVAVADVATVTEDSGALAIPVLTNDTDPDGGPISISAVTQPANGTVVITGGGSGLTYAPSPNY
jgi:large repetitive protein